MKDKKPFLIQLLFCAIIFLVGPQSSLGAVELFGKMEIKSSLASVPMWKEVIARNKSSPLFIEGAKVQTSKWDELKAKWINLPLNEQLKEVNLFWNKMPYRQDIEVWKKKDYWASPLEFNKRSGDCEDYAIAKYFTLVELGIPKDKMRIALVTETVRNINHAVLVVYTDNDDALVLDNLNNKVTSHRINKQYDIHFSLNEFYKWGHFKGKK